MTLCALTVKDFVGTLTLQRPEVRNALSLSLLDEMDACLRDVAQRADIHCVILAGSTPRAFCAGADLKERAAMTQDQARAAVDRIRAVVEQVASLPQPVIAAVAGVALGGGCELALACDLRLIAADAMIGLTETRLAIIPGAGGTQRLSRLIGPGRAKELILTGRRITGEQAAAIGLAERLVPTGEEVLLAATEWAREIAAGGPIALRAAKAAIDRGLDLSLAEGLRVERSEYERVLATEDRLEGLNAFAQKRTPRYQGR